MHIIRIKLAAGLVLLAAVASALPAAAEKVGEVGVDWPGSDIIVEAIADPKVQGVACHVAYFERGLVDRINNGNWFEDPSENSIACRQTSPIIFGDIDRSEDGENVFRSANG
jgi:CreA protein